MNRWKRISSAISCFLTGATELTPQQQARLDEMEKDCAELSRAKSQTRSDTTAANPILPGAAQRQGRTASSQTPAGPEANHYR